MNPEQNLPDESKSHQEELEQLRREAIELINKKQQIPGYRSDLHKEVVASIEGCQDLELLKRIIKENQRDLDEWPSKPPPDRKIGAMIVESLDDPQALDDLKNATPEEREEMSRLRDLLKSSKEDDEKNN